MHRIVNDEALDALFRAARCHYAWRQQPVSETLLRALWELVKLGPRGEARPARIVFARSAETKTRLAAAVPGEQRAAAAGAPVVAVVAQRAEGGPCETALDAAYLIVAARALGLDCGPLWRFDAQLADAALFADGSASAMFLMALGYGDEAQPAADEPRRTIDEACDIL